MTRIRFILLALSIFVLDITACSNTSTPIPELNVAPTIALPQEQKPTPTVAVSLMPTQAPNRLPLTEADVPRVTVENAKAAFDSGKAIIVDVRSKPAYDASHIAGALYIPLADIENKPSELGLDKEQWIITYCT